MRSLGLVAADLVVCASQASPNQGYLPVVGPAPLRFELQVTAVLAPLPPLNSGQEAAPGDATTQGADKTGPATAPTGSSVTGSTPAKLGGTNDLLAVPLDSAQGASVETNAAPAVTAQMLMQYFLGRMATNREPVVREPLHFSPPPPPSSSATYTSEPKQ